uniref:Reverse transcriptase domain-containing protein n=1 Tax=Tanacetum cinerariifolium TaxID=118510 RepID=A0A699HKK9_TANCI|nr:reverse transcriptase domain-containing protein [Tanacetum cinerariifolium]
MASPVIAISSDASEESIGSVVSRVILFGTIPTEILSVPYIHTDLPTAPELPAVLPFLCSDDSESDSESEPADELPERHVSLRHHDDVVAKVISRPSLPSGSSSPDTTILSPEILVAPTPPTPSTKITTAPPACETLTPVITASPAVRSRIRTKARKGTLGLRPMMTPTRSAALRKARRATLSSKTSSSGTSSGSSSDSTSHILESSFTASLQSIQISPKDHSHHSSETARSPSEPLTSTSIPSIVHTAGALSPARADLPPPQKRYRGTSAMHSYESSDEGSPETHTESDMNLYIQADIEAETTTAAATVDGLGIEPDMAVVETGFETGLVVVESESEPEEAEADYEADAEIQPKGTIYIKVDVTTGINIPNDLHMPDTIERLEKLEESVQALDSINTRLRYTLCIERVRVDSLQRCLGYVEDEFRQIRELRAYESQRLWRMETFLMLGQAIEELIYQWVAEALAAQEANHNAVLVVESQRQNENDDDNRNRGNENHGNNNEDGNQNKRNGGARRNATVAKACTYKDFLNCQPRNFSGTEGVVGLARWFEKIELVFRISNCPPNSQVKFATCTLLDGALTWWNSHVQTIGIDEGTDVAGYTRRFQELTLLCPRMVLEENDKIKRFIWGLPDNIQGNVTSSKPVRLQDAIRMANGLMDQKDCKTVVTAQTLRAPVANQRVVTCFGCGGQGHYKSDCPKLKNQDRGNKAANNNACGRAYALGGGDGNPNSNVVTGTFLLNNRYTYILFNSGANRSFVSTTFSVLIDSTPTTLDVSYTVELANGRIARSDTIIRGCTLNLLDQPFNIDLMFVELGSFDVLIGIDWLSKYHVVIVCDEKIVRIPCGNEILIIRGDGSSEGSSSRLSIISCTKTQKYIQREF